MNDDATKQNAEQTDATFNRLYVRFGLGLRDEYGDSVDYLVDTKPFEGSVEYVPADEIERLRAENDALRKTNDMLRRELALAIAEPETLP